MRVIVVGLGSMGKRRIRLILQMYKDIKVVGVDSRADRRKQAEDIYRIDTVESLDDAIGMKAKCCFVCTSPLSHADIIEICLQNKLHVFTEINLVSNKYDSNIKLANDNNLVLFLSSTFVYREEINYIKERVKKSKSLLSYTYHVGQYLPDWHPWENYTDYFIGDTRTNGCREIMAIDFPWLYLTFGPIKNISVRCQKKTTLKTTYTDSYLLLIEHVNGIQGTFVVDVVSRKPVRDFLVFGEDLHISWNGESDGLIEYDIQTGTEQQILLYDSTDHQEGYSAQIIENDYMAEIMAFFDVINVGKLPEYGFEDDKYILNIIDLIESNQERIDL